MDGWMYGMNGYVGGYKKNYKLLMSIIFKINSNVDSEIILFIMTTTMTMMTMMMMTAMMMMTTIIFF